MTGDPPWTSWGMFAACASEFGDSPAAYDEHGTRLTFAELHERAEGVAAGLYECGFGAGSRVTWQLPTRIETVVLILGLSRLGAVQNPVIPLYGKREVGFILRQIRAELFIVPGEFRGTDFGAMALELRSQLAPGISGEHAGSELQVLLTSQGLPQADPKGICHTDATILASGNALVVAHALTRSDVGSIAFPIAHAGGAQYLASMFQVGFPALLLERFSPAESLAVMREHRVTIVGGGSAFSSAILAEQRRRPDEPVPRAARCPAWQYEW